jgi:KEOPS complex subunit Pcc1
MNFYDKNFYDKNFYDKNFYDKNFYDKNLETILIGNWKPIFPYLLQKNLKIIGGNPLKLFAEFTFETEAAETIYRSLLPELDDNFSQRSAIGLSLEDANKLVLSVKAEDVVSLRSALNTWFRLIQIAQEVLETTSLVIG